MHTIELLTNLVAEHQTWAYFFVFLGVIVEGELVVISSGILAHLGALSIPVTLVAVLLGGLTKSLLGYYVGRFCKDRWGDARFFCYMQKKVSSVLPRFKRKPFWSIFISKFILGANHLVILFSGFEKISFKKYIKAEILATLIWAPLMLAMGYVFSYTALHISQEIWKFSLIVLILFLLFVAIDKALSLLYGLFAEVYYGNKEEQ